jgi:hypothetical protein
MPAEVKISQLPAIAISAGDIAPFVHSGVTGQATAQQVYEANRRDAIFASAHADGTAPAVIVFSPAFPSVLLSLNGIVFLNYSGADVPALVYKITGASAGGFTILVTGGEASSTVDIHYGATGE